MLRKAKFCILTLFVCVVMVAGIDGAWHAMALERLQKRDVALSGWRHRLLDRSLVPPRDVPNRFRAWLQCATGSPGYVRVSGEALDDSLLRDLGIVRMKELHLDECRGFTPAVVAKLSGISSIKRLAVTDSGLTDETLNLVWSRLPNLEWLDLRETPLSAEGFRDIKKARSLKNLSFWKSARTSDQLMARLAEAPALEWMWLEGGEFRESTVSRLASMPALQGVYWAGAPPDAEFIARLKALKPNLQLLFF